MALTPVQKELERISSDFRRYYILLRLSICWGVLLVAGIGLLLLKVLLGIEWPYAVGGLIGVAALAAGIVFLRSRTIQVGLRDIARQVEKDDPALNTLLLAAVDQNPDPETGELSFLQLRVIREALAANRKSPWSQKVIARLFRVQCLHLFLFTVLCAVLFVLGVDRPEGTGTLARRGEISISPGNTAVERGSTVAVVAEFPEAPSGEVRLVYHSPSQGERRVSMTRSLNDPIFGATLMDVQDATSYTVEYGSDQSEQFRIEVFEYPELKRADADLKFPAYTKYPARKIEDTRRVTAVEGTEVSYSFFLNKPVKSAKLVGKESGEVILTNAPGEGNHYRADFALDESKNYLLQLVDAEGRTNRLPPEFVLVALPNEKPKMKLQSPRGDQRVSALQELIFEGEAADDFGLLSYGLGYSFGSETELVPLSEEGMGTNEVAAAEHEAKQFNWLLALESLSAQPDQLISYFLWAEDMGPDGLPRRTMSDIYFAEVRPFEEIFRESNSDASSSQQQGQQGGGPTGELVKLQKEIIQATWNLHRNENEKKPSEKFAEDAGVIRDSQESAIAQAEGLERRLQDEKSKAIVGNALEAMETALENLEKAAGDKIVTPLSTAVEFEQSAYQALLKLQAREYQVSRSRNSNSGQSQGGQQRAQRQLDQLELKQEENRYESQSQAAPLQNQEQRENVQVLNRLKELARRQQDMSERLKELQTALNEAKTKEEKEAAERMLKRLQEEQQQILQDMDEVSQRMAQGENRSRMAEEREQLEKTRQESRQAAEEMQQGNLSQALSSSSRAQQDLEKLSDDFRKASASQFSEEMRQMQQQSRELEKNQQELAEKLHEIKDSRQRTLSDEGPKKAVADALNQQRAALTNLLQNMRTVTEQAENAEPLLSRQLYETLRRTAQANPEKNLELTSQLLERNFLPQAAGTEERARETISQLNEGVERAAQSVLGDEAESLRLAQRELEDLARRVERELERGRAAGAGTNNMAAGAEGENGERAGTGELGTNRLALASQPGANPSGQRRPGRLTDSPGQEADSAEGEPRAGGDREGQSEGEAGENEQQAGREPGGQNGSQGENNRDGEQPGEGQEGRGQQQGERPGGGQGEGDGEQPGETGNGQGEGQNGGSNNRQQGRNFYEQFAGPGGSDNGGGNFEGPLTGENFTQWSDRLRDLEEVLQDPQLRSDVARVRETARSVRSEYKRHAALPQWDLVEGEILEPLRILQNRVAEELARKGSREALVPVDRDPVPKRYSEAVSEYYERLGKD